MAYDSDMPNGWARIGLAQLAELSLGKMLDEAKNTTGQLFPYLRNINVRWGYFNLTDLAEMRFDTDELERFGLKSGDVLICEGGEPGRAAVWPGSTGPIMFQKALHRVRPKLELKPKWLVLQLEHDAKFQRLDSLFTGSTIRHLTGASLKGYYIHLPPAAEQRRIIEKLDALRSRISTARDRIRTIHALLSGLRQSLLAAAFRGDLTADWRARNPDVEPADKLLESIRTERRRRWEAAELDRLTAKGKPPTDDRWKDRYQQPRGLEDKNLPELPAGWTWASAEETSHEVTVGYVGPMKNEYIDSGVPFLRSQNVRENRFDPKEIKYISTSFHSQIMKSVLRAGDVVIVRSGAPGTTCVIPSELGEANCSDLVIVRPSKFIAPWLLSYFLNSSFARGRVLDLQVGVAQQHFNVGAMKTLPLPIPPEEEQLHIIKRIRTAFESIERTEHRLQTLRALQSDLDMQILAKAFRGELVSQDPNDEPASVLLERLRTETAASPSKPGRRARVSSSTEDVPSELTSAAPQSHRVASRPTPAALTNTVSPSAPVPPAPAPRFGQQRLALEIQTVDFLELPAEAQAERVHTILLGEGPLEREDAVRRAADLLRDAGLVAFQRLRRDGPLAACIDAALSVGLREARFDRPARGSVRAVAPDSSDVPAPLWRRALLAALSSPLDTDEAVRAAADWAQAQFGLDFKRLRTGGHIDTALRAALAELRASGDVVEDGHGLVSVRTRSAT